MSKETVFSNVEKAAGGADEGEIPPGYEEESSCVALLFSLFRVLSLGW